MSEKFDEHESDTAKRAYPREVVEEAKRTTKMSPFTLDKLQHESGTRRAVSYGAIDRHVRSELEGAFAEQASTEIEVDFDPHSRPTVHGTPEDARAAGHVELTADVAASPAAVTAIAPPVLASPSISEPKAAITAPGMGAWVVRLAVVVVVLLVSAAATVGFFAMRRTGR